MMCTSSIYVQFWEKWRWQGPLLNLCCDWDVCDLWVCIYPQRQQGFFLTVQKGKCPRMPLSETGLSLLLTSNPMELFLLTKSNTSDASWFQTQFDVPLWRSRIHFLSECSVTLKQNTCSEHMTRIHDKVKKKVIVCENFTIIKLSKLPIGWSTPACLRTNMDAKTPCFDWTLIKTIWSSRLLIRLDLLITFLWWERYQVSVLTPWNL